MVIRLYGPDTGLLRDKAAEISKRIADVPGVADLKVAAQMLVPHIQIRLKPETAALFGLTPGQVRRADTTLVSGNKVGEFYRDRKVFDVTVWGAERVRHDLTALPEALINTPSGAQVP